jgi:hypothetical protein
MKPTSPGSLRPKLLRQACRLLAAAMLGTVLTGPPAITATAGTASQKESFAPLTPSPHFEALLAAGDLEEPVFDNAVRALERRLVSAQPPVARIDLLSADDEFTGSRAETATYGNLTHRIAALHTKAGDGCFVFLTSHGQEGHGLWLARSQRALTPDALDQALTAGCGTVPTIAVVSGCYTGSFAQGVMTRPNRIILTAARADRPSFGCSADLTYTFFDECFLGALDGAATWRVIFDRTRRCVARKEHQLGARPSHPQAFFGKAVANLQAPWP